MSLEGTVTGVVVGITAGALSAYIASRVIKEVDLEINDLEVANAYNRGFKEGYDRGKNADDLPPPRDPETGEPITIVAGKPVKEKKPSRFLPE